MPVYDEQIKRPGEEYSYTIEEIKELKKCKDDLFYFLNKVKIIHPDRGRIVFKPYPFQKDMFNLLLNNRFVAILCARQQGKCTHYNTEVLIRSKKTKKEKKIKIGELFDKIAK